MCLLLCCGVTASQHAQNVQSSTEYSAGLAACLATAKLQPAGQQMVFYHKCACGVDAHFSVDSGLCDD